MEKFYIDRQFGQAIWIEVEKGIVQRCYNESEKFNSLMNETYVGKSITFLNEDFIGRAMKGTYHHLRPESITSNLQRVDAAISQIRHLDKQIRDVGQYIYKDMETKNRQSREIFQLETLRGGFINNQNTAEKELKEARERILTEHNFKY